MKVILKNIAVEVKIGIHDHEKVSAQKVLVSIEATLPKTCILSAHISETVDYDVFRQHVLSWTQAGHVDLIEELIFDLFSKIFLDRRIQKLKIQVSKIDIFAETDLAGIEVELNRLEWEQLSSERKHRDAS